MLRNRVFLVVGALVIFSMILSACAPTPTEVPGTPPPATATPEPTKPSFSTPHPMLGDLRVRQALAYCTDKLALVQAAYPLNPPEQNASLVMNTFIPSAHWAYAGDDNVTIYPFNPTIGQTLLDEAGWILDEASGFRFNAAGDELVLHFTTTNATFRQTWAAVWEKQMANCGILIIRQHVPGSWWFGDTTGVKRRDYELGAFAWVGQPDPGGQTLYACDQIPTVENNWTGQNGMGWCNQKASDAIKAANNTFIKADRIAQYLIVQQEFTKDMVSIPLFNRSSYYAYNPGWANLVIAPGDQDYYMWNPWEWQITNADGTVKDTIVIGFTQEPSTLFQPVVDAYVARAAGYFISGLAYTSLNYDFQAVEQKELSTLESGLATSADVAVNVGDTVVDANGNNVVLEAAPATPITLLDSTGAMVDYTGQAVTMKQMTVTYEFLDGMTFSDGVPLAQEDLELGYKVLCDKEVGATSYITCDAVKTITFDGLSYTIAWLPGRSDPLYFLAPFGWYPAHQVVETAGAYQGMMLKDVPPKDWSTLPEAAEKPMDVGAYMLTEWVVGEYMKFETNPYFYGPAPLTPTIIIQFITSENATAQLLAGAVDMLDSTTIISLSQVLKDAADAGTITILVNPSTTWEHIDMNMWLK
jgi:ABC-type transport system substrate-binding protein